MQIKRNQGSDNIPQLRFPECKVEWKRKKLGVTLSGRAIRYNLFFVPQKRISTTIPNANTTTI
jgi:hypothetical protein